MLKCCVCGKSLTSPRSWVCGACALTHNLAVDPAEWPEWAQSEKRREEARRRFEPSYGLSSERMRSTPYRRKAENQSYRKSSRVRKPGAGRMVRINADDLFYSSGESGPSSHDVSLVLDDLPFELRQRLLQHAEAQTILADAIRSLPLVSQRAILATIIGKSVDEIATDESLSDTTVRWLLSSAKRHLGDLLCEKLGTDDGQRFG